MPQHAVSAGQDQVEDAIADQGPKSALPACSDDAYTFSPPLAGNDVSSAEPENAAPLPPEPVAKEAAVDERPDGSNDNIPSDRALVVPESCALVVPVTRSTRPWAAKSAAAIGVLAVLGVGVAAFSYLGSAEPKKGSPPRMELASVPPLLPQAEARAPQPSAAETNTRSIAVAPQPETIPTASAESAAQPEPTVPPPPAPELTAPLPENTVQPQSAPAPRAEAVAPRAIAETPPRPATEPRIAALPNPEAPRPPAPIPNQPSAEAPPPASSRSVALSPPALGRGQVAFVQRPGVNIRNAPAHDGEILGSAQMGGRFIIAGREGEWVQVAQGPWRGWIHQRFLGPRLPREAVRGSFF
jgi:hypothetical protein